MFGGPFWSSATDLRWSCDIRSASDGEQRKRDVTATEREVRVGTMDRRRKGNMKINFRTQKALTTERDLPHLVEIELPLSGLNTQMNREMVTFHRLHNIRPRFGRRRTQAGKKYCRGCFSNPEIADLFRERFGGERVRKEP
jgi:hypothetical protein